MIHAKPVKRIEVMVDTKGGVARKQISLNHLTTPEQREPLLIEEIAQREAEKLVEWDYEIVGEPR